MSNIVSQLFEHAAAARVHAYAPYSNFAVGAALLDERGKIFSGCNVENVSYPCGTCAEAGAIAAMAADGGRLIREILVIADSNRLITPCGACLQRIAEFSDNETLVHLADLKGVQNSCNISKLLPYAFNEKELRND